MSGSSQRDERSIHEQFKNLLKSQWTYPVVCQNRCEPKCVCQRHIVHVDAVQNWWLRKTSDTQLTNLHRMLDELPPSVHGNGFPLSHKNLFTGEQSCLRVFSLLLQKDLGHLVDLFHESNMNDKYLSIMHTESSRDLQRKLGAKEPGLDAKTIVDNFNKEKWQYCPLEMTLHMAHNLHGTKVIPPFCHKIKLGDKGGTASVYWVAIKKEFIREPALQAAIIDSLYADEQYGECYQMVLKSYCGNKKSVYDLEKSAFLALSQNKEVPIIRYLGCYEHDYGEGPNNGNTYNLLLECGQRDLYQAWADETNVPPVRAGEIIQFWKSLFGVADAIRHIHNLELPRNGKAARPLKYFGWHADIKPDNILFVSKRLKLADFGYSKFTPVAQNHHGGVPTELIEGFTDTYGAPEVSRMKQPDGTLTGVTQSIDTWSFGCVLSVAATWVVLGFQGVRQFIALRQLAKSNQIRTKTYDRFHDGVEVLPEIRQWHNYLRGHARSSDTATSLVLDLVENKMLQTQPSNRIELKDLCEELKKILSHANFDISGLKTHSRVADAVVLKALLKIEKQAHEEKSERRKTTSLLHQPVNPTEVAALGPLQRAAMQVDKDEFYRTRPLGQTPYRKQILEDELKDSKLVEEVAGNADQNHHNGEFTDSPTDHVSFADPFVRAKKPINPNRLSPLSYQPEGLDWPGPACLPTSSNATVSPLLMPGASSPEAPEISMGRQGQESPEDSLKSRDKSALRGFPRNNYAEASKRSPGPPSQHPAFATTGISGEANVDVPMASADNMSSPATGAKRSSQSKPYVKSSPKIGEPQSPPIIKQYQSDYDIPQLKTPTPKPKNASIGHPHSPEHGYDAGHESFTIPQPSFFLSQPPQSPGNGQSEHGHPPEFYSNEKQAVHDRSPPQRSPSRFLKPIPYSVFDLPYDVCKVRIAVDKDIPKGTGATIKNLLRLEARKADKSLAKTYGDGREIIFVVDNGASMFEHWPIVVFVAETLVKKAAGLDKSGVDLSFTIDGSNHNRTRLKRDQGRQEFRKALDAAAPDNVESQNNQTDMFATLSDIVKDWKDNGSRPTTLIVLTDGVWKQTLNNLLENIILNVAKDATHRMHSGSRPFSIQFVRFGEKEEQKERLSYLDDKLCKDRLLRDIVDHCSWRSDVEKILKGSIDGQYDEDENEQDIPYDYIQLVQLFRKFNDDAYEEGPSDSRNSFLLPVSSTRNSIARSPSRGSNASSSRQMRTSMPVQQQQVESWTKGHSRTPFST